MDNTIAYKDRLDREHQPTQQEVEFRRFTSGGFVDNAKGH